MCGDKWSFVSNDCSSIEISNEVFECDSDFEVVFFFYSIQMYFFFYFSLSEITLPVVQAKLRSKFYKSTYTPSFCMTEYISLLLIITAAILLLQVKLFDVRVSVFFGSTSNRKKSLLTPRQISCLCSYCWMK